MYLDSAILVKLFAPEPDSEFYAKLVDGQILFTSAISFTEVFSAMLAKERQGSITPKQRNAGWLQFERNVDDHSIHLTDVTFAVLKKANRILQDVNLHVPLRSLDAIHLATCDMVQQWPLSTNDKRMKAAAEYLKFPLGPISQGS